MIEMTEKEKYQQRTRAEDAAFNRMLVWLVGAVIAEVLVLFVKRFFAGSGVGDVAYATLVVCAVFSLVGLALTVLGVVWCVLSAKKKAAMQLPVAITIAVAFVWLLSVMVYCLGVLGTKIMMFVPIAAIVLIMIYFLYNRSFFVNAIMAACGMLALWGVRHFSGPIITAAFVIGWICLIAVFWGTFYLKKNNGRVGKIHLVSDSKCYLVCRLNCAVVFVLTLLGFVLGMAFAYYLLYVLIGWLFCLAVYYTVKLL